MKNQNSFPLHIYLKVLSWAYPYTFPTPMHPFPLYLTCIKLEGFNVNISGVTKINVKKENKYSDKMNTWDIVKTLQFSWNS